MVPVTIKKVKNSAKIFYVKSKGKNDEKNNINDDDYDHSIVNDQFSAGCGAFDL
jgi:hypothetical protein